MLELEDVQVRYGDALAVAGATMQIPRGGWVALVGANGAGKTSLLRAVVGLAPHGGRTILAGEDVTTLPAWERQRRGIGYVPEGRQLFPQMSVDENLRVGGITRGTGDVQAGLDSVYEIFPHLANRRRQAAGNLSGGEQQMLALGRALMTRPKLVVIDEISWGLMPILVIRMFELLDRLHGDGLTIFQAEQSARRVLRHAQYAYVMAAGRMVLEGAAADVARDPRIVDSYLGA